MNNKKQQVEPNLRDFRWETTYKSNHGDIVQNFFIPALERSVIYRRVAGYYSSSVLEIAAAGIARLIQNGGEMELIVGADLSRTDVDAINAGALTIHDYVSNEIPASFDNYDELKRFLIEERYKALYWLIAKRRLKIKIALVLNEEGNLDFNQKQPIFHEKWGLFIDHQGNQLGFIGSVNESKAAWVDNQERIKALPGWTDKIELIRDEITDFPYYWNDKEPGIRIMEVTDAIEQKLIRYRETDIPITDPFEETQIINRIKNKIKPSSGEKEKDQNNPLWGPIDNLFILNPKQFYAYLQTQFISALPGLDHSWNALLQTITIEPMQHQIYIAHELFNHFPRGYMLCDEVGLGKTIEAGLAIKWLYFTEKVKRILIIVPKNVIKQWQEELREKFNLEFMIYDGTEMISYWNEHYTIQTQNPYNSTNLILVSSGLVQLEKRSQQLLEAADWDLILFDEAHHLRRKPPKTQGTLGSPGKLLKLAQKIKYQTRSIWLLTATPLQMRISELFDLLSVLGLGGKWGLFENFDRYYKILETLPNLRSKEDWQFLMELAQDFLQWGRANKDIYANELRQLDSRPKYFRDLLNLFTKDYDLDSYFTEYAKDSDFFIELSKELESLSPLRWYMFRNTRPQLRSYGIHVPDRKPDDVSIEMTREEQELYQKIEHYIVEIYNNATEEQKSAIGFTLTVYRRRLTSSFVAIKQTLEKRIKKLEYIEKHGELSEEDSDALAISEIEEEDLEDNEFGVDSGSESIDGKSNSNSSSSEESIFGAEEEIEEPHRKMTTVLAKGSFTEEIEYIRTFIQEIDDFLKRHKETKFEKLVVHLNKANEAHAKRMLVFTQYTDTLDFLKEELRQRPDFQELGCYSGNGGDWLKFDPEKKEFNWESATKEEIKRWFFEPSSFKIMLCTDAASEGLNFHVCNYMVNYDLPWNPMRVEQRIGRIDRVKQEADELFIWNFMYTNTIEGRIYSRLWDRIRIFQKAVGPLRPILNVYQKAENFAIAEGDEQLDEGQIEAMLGNIQYEVKIAEDYHNFFQGLLTQRILPDIEASLATSALTMSEFYFNWISNYFSSNLYQCYLHQDLLSFKNKPGIHENAIKIPNFIEFQIQDQYIECTGQMLFNQIYFINHFHPLQITSKKKGEIRNIRDNQFKFNLMAALSLFDVKKSSYFITQNTTLFENLLYDTNPYKNHQIPVLLSDSIINGHNPENIEFILRLDFANYPKLKQIFLLHSIYDLKTKQLSEIQLLNSWEPFFQQFNQLPDKSIIQNSQISEIFSRINTDWQKITSAINNHVLNFQETDMFKKSIKNSDLKEYSMRWQETLHDFEAKRSMYRLRLLKEFQRWLIMAFLYELNSNDWESIKHDYKLEDYITSLSKTDRGSELETVLDAFNLGNELKSIPFDHPLVKALIKTYKNKKKYKLFSADHERYRKGVFDIIESWQKEETAFKMQQTEHLKNNQFQNSTFIIIATLFK